MYIHISFHLFLFNFEIKNPLKRDISFSESVTGMFYIENRLGHEIEYKKILNHRYIRS